MDAPLSNSDLLDRYLTGLALPAETAELARRVREDAGFAEEFANACRLDANLAERFRVSQAAWGIHAALSARSETAAEVRPEPPSRRVWVYTLAGCAAAFIVAAVLAAAFWTRDTGTALPAPVSAGQVLSGSVLVDRAPGRPVTVGSEVRPAGDAPAVVRLGDGSEATLHPSAVAVFRGPTGGLRQQVELRAGKAEFEVSKGQGTFEVTTPVGKVTALGTAFTVELPAQGTQEKGASAMKTRHVLLAVAVLSGAVQVQFGGKDYRLGPGDNCLFAAKGDKPAKIGLVGGKLTEVDADSVTITSQGKGGGDTARDVGLTAETKVLVETTEMETVQVPAKTGDGTVSIQRPKVRDGTAADLAVGKRVTAKVGADGKALEILILNPRVKLASVSGELTKVESGSVAVRSTFQAKDKDGQTTEKVTEARVDGDTKVRVETEEMETVEVPAKGGEGTVSVQRPKVRDGTLADLAVGKRVTVKIDADGRAVEILLPRPAPAKGSKEPGAGAPAVKQPGSKEPGNKPAGEKKSAAKEKGGSEPAAKPEKTAP